MVVPFGQKPAGRVVATGAETVALDALHQVPCAPEDRRSQWTNPILTKTIKACPILHRRSRRRFPVKHPSAAARVVCASRLKPLSENT